MKKRSFEFTFSKNNSILSGVIMVRKMESKGVPEIAALVVRCQRFKNKIRVRKTKEQVQGLPTDLDKDHSETFTPN